ncbi:MAG: winged helix-turn-helix domain-containing protein [Pseudomonadota bacterium]
MREGPDIARTASLIGDPARANILCALLDGRALTAGELTEVAGVTKATASTHLAQLVEAGLLAKEAQGRHRYFRLAHPDVALALEALMGVAERGAGRRVRTGPKDSAMRRARVCYDHLAGELAVQLYDHWLESGWLIEDNGSGIELTSRGRERFSCAGIDVHAIDAARRPNCKTCLDWSMRRYHLAGGIGQAVLTLMEDRRWAMREAGSRLVTITDRGEKAIWQALG